MIKVRGPHDIPVIQRLELDEIPKGSVGRYWVEIITDAFGNPVHVPLMIAKGHVDGPTLGLTAAVHGNELNGIPVIQRLFKEIDVNELKGTLVGVPVVNVPSLMRKKRRFVDGRDLNHIMPGKPDGNVSEIYAWRFFHRIVTSFDYLLDLHTASSGRVNSYYIRADMDDEQTAVLALLQNPQIIVHNPPSDGTLRGAAEAIGISAITLEVGNPSTFQKGMIHFGLTGITNVMAYLDMIQQDVIRAEKTPFMCKSSYWKYTDKGGILTILPNVTDQVKKGDCVARLQNIFGDLIESYEAPEDGIVIGKIVSPINQTGGRILHLGIPQDK